MKKRMKHYSLYGMHIVSDFDFVQLDSLDNMADLKPDIVITEGIVAEEYKKDEDCYSQFDKKISFLSNRTCYLQVENGEKITYERKENAKESNLNAFLLGWGIAMICYQKEKLAIHCACIANDEGAVLISGTSGSGKSSITSVLLKKGYRLVADDMTVVYMDGKGTAYATPAFPYQKLCRDVAMQSDCTEDEMIYIDENKDKFLVPYKGEFMKEPVPIKAMILLGISKKEEVSSGEVEGIEKMYACVDAMFLKGLLKEKLFSPENVNLCLEMASCVPIYYVNRPVEMDTREEVINTINNWL